jgi:hypothetical protein
MRYVLTLLVLLSGMQLGTVGPADPAPFVVTLDKLVPGATVVLGEERINGSPEEAAILSKLPGAKKDYSYCVVYFTIANNTDEFKLAGYWSLTGVFGSMDLVDSTGAHWKLKPQTRPILDGEDYVFAVLPRSSKAFSLVVVQTELVPADGSRPAAMPGQLTYTLPDPYMLESRAVKNGEMEQYTRLRIAGSGKVAVDPKGPHRGV